jgi:hypothetical protein
MTAASQLHVRLIGKANGVGLSRDFELLAAALRQSGCEVSLLGCERRERKRRRSLLTRFAARLRRLGAAHAAAPVCDVNLMLEHTWPQFLHQARCNVLVPNPEWFDRRDLGFLAAMDRVWVKTAMAEALFAARGCRCQLIGFDSEDRYLPQVPRQGQFLHLAGRSPLKGTQRLLALWQRHPEWPQLTLVQDAPAVGQAARPAGNIVQQRGYLDDAQLRTLQNSHRYHLCTSEAEGWGHYIAEALSVQAVALVSDAPPMNELVSAERGLLVGVRAGERHNLVRLALFEDSALEAAVQRALSLGEAESAAIGAAGRSWFLHNKRGFAGRLQHAVADLRLALAAAAAPVDAPQP